MNEQQEKELLEKMHHLEQKHKEIVGDHSFWRQLCILALLIAICLLGIYLFGYWNVFLRYVFDITEKGMDVFLQLKAALLQMASSLK